MNSCRQSTRRIRLWSPLVFVLPLALFVGCGGGDDTSSPLERGGGELSWKDLAKQPNAGGPAAPAAQAAAPAQPAPGAQGANARSKKQDSAAEEKSEPAGDPNDMFVTAGNADEFRPGDVAETTIADSDRFAMIVPSEGRTTATFGPGDVIAPLPPGTTPQAVRTTSAARTAAARDSRLPKGFTPLPESGFTESGLPRRIVCDLDGAEMVLIEAGIFVQGAGPKDRSRFPETNALSERRVYLSSYYIDVFEVTLERYEKFVAARQEGIENGSKERPAKPAINAGAARDEPAVGVTWTNANQYAEWTGRELPTEAQWEKAARGDQGFKAPWGNGRAIWGSPRTVDQITPVGAFAGDLSPFGVYDMAGNAREWCSDFYSEGKASVPTGQVIRNPTGPRSSGRGYLRVVKGGDPDWLVWSRDACESSRSRPEIGFRTVLRIAGDDESEGALQDSTTGRQTAPAKRGGF